ncbi:hypothetical protein [Bradyrhizobium sp. RDI18]|uniref:hypothetical protein n=1 Tax=Bradyrhizobium sp. RDI18 TaxID=3367400 RepID=UPI003716D41F
MAAGAIPPPLFFEQRRLREHLASVHGILKNGLRYEHPGKYNQRSRNLNGRRAQGPTTRAMTAEG